MNNPTFTYTFRLSADERQKLAEIAAHVVRTDAEALRLMIHGAHQAITGTNQPAPKPERGRGVQPAQ